VARHALLIGVSEFADRRLARLNAPANDVTALQDILKDSSRGNFDSVERSLNEDFLAIRDRLSRFFHERTPDDQLLFYYSGHGILGRGNRLFLATAGSDLDAPRDRSISAREIRDFLEESRAQTQVVILDCCHSGAFAEHAKAGALAPAVTEQTFSVGEAGLYVLTAADTLQFAWDGSDLRTGEEEATGFSRFTSWLVEGLKNGEAAPDDEHITLDALYRYLFRRARAEGSATPQRFVQGSVGDLVISANPLMGSSQIDAGITTALDADEFRTRLGAVAELTLQMDEVHTVAARAARRLLQRHLQRERDLRVRRAISMALEEGSRRPAEATRQAEGEKRPAEPVARQAEEEKQLAEAARKREPEISEEAFAAVLRMAQTLSAERFSFQAHMIIDAVDADGEPHKISRAHKVTVCRPNRLLADVTGDDGSSTVAFDGKTATVYWATQNNYASITVPQGTVKAMLKELERFDIAFVLDNFVTETVRESFLEDVTEGRLIDRVTIDGTPCLQMRFIGSQQLYGAETEWEAELWVENNDQSLPRRYIIDCGNTPLGQVKIRMEFSSWDFSIHASDTYFVFRPPAGAEQVQLIAVSQRDQLINLFQEKTSIHVQPDIPSDKVANARMAADVPQNGDIWILFDLTFFGSAKDCMVATQSGVFYHNEWSSPEKFAMDYGRLQEVIITDDRNGVKVGDVKLNFGRGNVQACRDFLRNLQEQLRALRS
jgi:hypothetical protein